MFYIELLDRKIFHNDINLFNEIIELIKPSYEDPSAILKREMQHCNKLYLARLDNGSLCAFFMVSWEALLVDGKEQPSVYLGLSATSSDTKNSGNIRALYIRFIKDAQEWEQENSQKLILWHTTATPSVFHAVSILFEKNEPDINGDYSPKNKAITEAIRLKMKWNNFNSTHPFVLHNIATGTCYSKIERERIERICREKNFTLFKKLNIDEAKGDRLLRISCVPKKISIDQKITLRAKL